mgnify:CR=1 FL=1
MAGVRRMDHVGIIVEDLEAATAFFLDLGLEVEGSMTVQGEWVESIIGLKNVHDDLVMMRTPDGVAKVELVKFHSPVDEAGPLPPAANRLGIRHITFLMDDLTATLDTLRSHGYDTIGQVRDYEDIFRVCYVHGPEGIIVELAEEIGAGRSR